MKADRESQEAKTPFLLQFKPNQQTRFIKRPTAFSAPKLKKNRKDFQNRMSEIKRKDSITKSISPI